MTLAAQARPPQAVLECGRSGGGEAGRGLEQGVCRRFADGQAGGLCQSARAGQIGRRGLSGPFPPAAARAILLGALASVYGKEDGGADTAVWLAAVKDETGYFPPASAHPPLPTRRLPLCGRLACWMRLSSRKRGWWCIRSGWMRHNRRIGKACAARRIWMRDVAR
jgi:hypothetical protein